MIELTDIDLMKELGLDSLPIEKQQQLASQMLEVVEKRIFREALYILTDREKKELDKVLDADDGDTIEFLRRKIPNFDILVAEIVADFKNEILNMRNNVS